MKLFKSILTLILIVAIGWTVNRFWLNPPVEQPAQVEQDNGSGWFGWFGGDDSAIVADGDEGDCFGTACNSVPAPDIPARKVIRTYDSYADMVSAFCERGINYKNECE